MLVVKYPHHRGYWKFQKDGTYQSLLFKIFEIPILWCRPFVN